MKWLNTASILMLFYLNISLNLFDCFIVLGGENPTVVTESSAKEEGVLLVLREEVFRVFPYSSVLNKTVAALQARVSSPLAAISPPAPILTLAKKSFSKQNGCRSVNDSQKELGHLGYIPASCRLKEGGRTSSK